MKPIRLFLITFLLLIVSNTIIFSQVKPSVYAGVGTGTNLGGIVGIGGEVKYNFLSLNVAVGNALGEQLPEHHTGAKSGFSYDFGCKLYAKFGVFGGINYGLIGASLSTKSGQEELHFEKNYGFSFTVGYRRVIYQHIYGLAYAGLTSDKDQNYLLPAFFDKRGFLPRMGLIVGYEF
ncbi:MAG: hypothetical protein LBT25_07240 [Candidatus Symbiothrix sp.]|jgi:hypothetical protein|nr:hypothetical protein [Candidatus Symbiothrix sp.]